jgi:hypothetical protein
MKPLHWLLIFIGIFTLAGSSFTLGRLTSKRSNTYYEVPAHEYADFHVSSETMTMTPMRDTSDLEAVKGTSDHYLYQQYKLDGTVFNAYYFRSNWTIYIQTGGHVPDTTVFVKYMGKAVCVSQAVDRLFITKFLR